MGVRLLGGRRFPCLLGVVFGLCNAAFAQQPAVRIPEGRRHFIVLVDSSASMTARSMPPAPPNTKRKALMAAERELASTLFDSNHIVKGPWYRKGVDLLTVIQYGIDTKPRADLAYLRLKDAKLDDDYVRRVIGARSDVSRKRFLAALNPKVHTQLNILAWALPLGLSAAAVPQEQVQDTYVILLNDAQMNDGSMVLEKHTMGMHLNPGARAKLAAREQLVESSVRLTGKAGFSSAWLEKSFGQDSDMVVITAFKAAPTTTTSEAEGMAKYNPLDSLRVDAGVSGLTASFNPEPELQGSDASLSIGSGHVTASRELILSPHNSVSFSGVDGQRGLVVLAVNKSASNPVLGIQKFQVLYEQTVVLPSSARTRLILGVMALFSVGICLAVWAYYHAVIAKHFKLWLPGYVTSFELPAISQSATSRYIVRQPVGNGEAAAALTLPPHFIRALFYRDATLRWDQKLCLGGNSDAETAKLSQLPRVAKLLWKDRPASSGEFTLSIERKLKSGRNQKAKINVRFLALRWSDSGAVSS